MNLEALELLTHGYFRCHYVSLYCPACDMIRWVTQEAPEGEYCDCPNCARPHCNFGLVGEGFTNKELPRHEIWWTAPRFIPADDEELEEMPAPSRVVDADHYVTAAGRVSSLPPKVYKRRIPAQAL